MLDTEEPASPTRRAQLRRPEVIRIASVVAAVSAELAAGVLLVDLDHNAVAGLLRLAAAVTLILLGVWLLWIHIARRLRDIEARLLDRIESEHEIYIRAYMDGLGHRGD
jgi:ABC-type nickel/cobalt efflux system permease component RcnA